MKKSDPKKPDPKKPDNKMTVDDVCAEFTASLPPGAEQGRYAASAHDAFAGRKFGRLDGVLSCQDWTFEFDDGRLLQAVHVHRAHALGIKAPRVKAG